MLKELVVLYKKVAIFIPHASRNHRVYLYLIGYLPSQEKFTTEKFRAKILSYALGFMDT